MKNGIEVYDYGEEDELPEVAPDKFSAKFKNPNLDEAAALKYEFIQCVAQGTTVPKQGIGNVLCVDVDAVECDSGCHNGNSFGQPGTGREEFATQTHSTSCEQLPDFKKDSFGCESCISELGSRDSFPEAPIPGKIQLNCGISQSPSNNEPVDVNSDADESMNEDSPTSPASDTMEDDVSLRGQVSDNCIDDLAMDDINMPVVICPDYVVYRRNCCSVSLVIFSCSGIKIKDLTAHGKEGTFSFEKQIDDIIDIKCQWFQRIKLAVIKLRVLSEDVIEGDDACGTGGIEELKFFVFEPNWSEKKDKITSLSDKYMALCNIVHEEDVEMEGDSSPEQRHYFHNFDEPFEDVIYPKGDSDAVSVSKRDVDLLQPETFVNDTIIDFYIKYLKNQIPPEERHRFHFFNSFFFRKLADLDKDPSSISDGRAAFLRVHKWTRKVDIFGKDYIFIPVNFSLHWSLIVICHPGEVTVFKDENTDKSEKVPCILHMDSMKGTHAGLKNLVQSYLMEEWKVRHKDTSEDLSSKFLTLRFMQLELPQQENLFDCGLFLLHYLELFLAEAPVNFSPFRLTKSSNFLNGDWFLPSEASLKRTLIEKLIFELLQNRSQELNSTVCDNEHQSSGVPENNQNEMAMEFLPQNCCAPIAQREINSQGSQGIEITLLAEASMRNMQCVNDSGLVLREFFEPGASAGSLLPQYQSFGQSSSNYDINGTISAREQEGGITDDGFAYLPSGENGFQQMSGLTPQAGTISYSRDYATEAPWNPEISMQVEHNADSSPEASYCASDDSEDVGIIERNPFAQEVSQGFKERTIQQRSPSVDDIACLTNSLAEDDSPGLKKNTTQQRSSSMDNIVSLTDPHEEDDSQGLNENTAQQRSLSMDNMACLTNPLAEDDSQGLKENTTQQRSLCLDPVACLTNPLADDDSRGLKENTTQRRSPLMDNNVCLTDPHVEDDSQGLKENRTEQRSPSTDNIACITDPLVEDDIQGLKEKTNQQRSPSVDRTICLTEGLASVPNEMLETSANAGAEQADKLLVRNENINLTACQENLTTLPDPNLIENGLHPGTAKVEISLNQDTAMGENREITSDEVICNDLPVDGNDKQQAAKRLQLTPGGEGELKVTSDEVICNYLPVDGNDEQQAAKRIQLMPPSGGEGELEVTSDEVICNDLPVDGNDEQQAVDGNDEQQAAKRPRLTPPSGGEGELKVTSDEVICNDLPVDGNDEQQAAKRLQLTPPSGGEGELEVTSDEVICNYLPVDGNDEQQAAKRPQLTPPSGGEGELEVTSEEVICNDLPVDGNDEQQAAKRPQLTPPSGGEGELEVPSDEFICDDLPVDGNDEQQAAKRPRLTPPSGGEGELEVLSDEVICDDLGVDGNDEQQAAKRPRLTPPSEGQGELTKSQSKDLQS